MEMEVFILQFDFDLKNRMSAWIGFRMLSYNKVMLLYLKLELEEIKHLVEDDLKIPSCEQNFCSHSHYFKTDFSLKVSN